MTRPGKLERNVNHDPGRLAQNKKSTATTIRSHDGFVGKPGAVHLHLVGKRWHLKLGSNKNSRANFTQTDETKVREILGLLENDPGFKGKTGAAECIAWCKQPANKRV